MSIGAILTGGLGSGVGLLLTGGLQSNQQADPTTSLCRHVVTTEQKYTLSATTEQKYILSAKSGCNG